MELSTSNEPLQLPMLNTFLFVDSDGLDPTTCESTIHIDSDSSFNEYVIKINSRFSDGKSGNELLSVIEHRCHPLVCMRQNNMLSYFKGFSVVKNDMTAKMLSFLMMEDNELVNHTGSITPMSYRRSILHALVSFSE
jgi:hypothetical protein